MKKMSYDLHENPRNRYVTTGGFECVTFGENYDSISTTELIPCIAVIAYNGRQGALIHFYTDKVSEEEVVRAIATLRTRMDPRNTTIALVGGVDARERSTHVPLPGCITSSEQMIEIVKKALDANNFRVDFEDLLGGHKRAVHLRANGLLLIEDEWDAGRKHPLTYQLTVPSIIMPAADHIGHVLNGFSTDGLKQR